VTYNFKEKESVREIYKLLNEYYQKQQPPKAEGELPENDDGEDDDEEDITKQLSAEIVKTQQETQEKSNLFQAVETGTNNCVFIKTSISVNHRELGFSIINDLFATKMKKTRFSNRLIPIDRVCRANITEITATAGALFDLHFLSGSSTFAINFNRRCNGDVKRDDVIRELAALVTQKNMKNKVNLKNPQKTVLIEIIKGLCCLSVIPDYLKLRKYNLNELRSIDKSSSNVEKTNGNVAETSGIKSD
jgi:tRNA acetyltransferase TAN1